jgi:hypothetical protein
VLHEARGDRRVSGRRRGCSTCRDHGEARGHQSRSRRASPGVYHPKSVRRSEFEVKARHTHTSPRRPRTSNCRAARSSRFDARFPLTERDAERTGSLLRYFRGCRDCQNFSRAVASTTTSVAAVRIWFSSSRNS